MIEFDIKKVLDQIPVNIYLKDMNGTLLYCNESSMKNYGAYSSHQIIGTKCEGIFSEDIAAEIRKNDLEVLSTGQIKQFEEIFFRYNEKVTVLSTKIPLKDEKGAIWGLFGISVDITEKEEALSLVEADRDFAFETLNNVISNLPGHVYWVDKNNVILGCNLQLALSAGLNSPKEMIGKTNYDLPWKDYADELNAINNKVMETGKEYCVEEEGELADGKKAVFLSRKVPLYDKSKHVIGILGLSLDITELKETKKELEKALEEAQAANADREKVLLRYQQFVNDQEHDIRTPVGGVASGTVAIEPMIKESPEEALEILKLIQISAQEILEYQESLLYDLYQGTRPGKSVFIRFDLPDIVQRVYNVNLATATLKKLSYRLDYDQSIPRYLLGEGKRVYQCLLDLVSNAVRFTSYGSVDIEVTYLNQLENKALIRFRIKDTGVGIPSDKQQDIYDAFVKIKPSNRGGERGRGLGLTRVNQYAKDMGGELWFESEVDKGSCFNLILPFAISLDQKG